MAKRRLAEQKEQARNVRIEIPPSLYPAQETILKYDGSLAVFGGRGCGKTRGAAKRILRKAVEKPGLYWWVGLDWRSASMREAWEFLSYWTREIWTQAGKDPSKFINGTDKTLILPGIQPDGTANQIWMRTAEHPESLAGKQINGAVGDEFTLWPRRVWDEYLRATTLVRRAWVCFIGIPKGDNWASEMWKSIRAQALGWEGWLALQIESRDNPLISEESLANIAATSPTWLFDQEYRGMIVAGVGRPFEGIDDCVMLNTLELPFNLNFGYYAAVDPAGGGADEMTLSIVHKENGTVIQDALRAAVLVSPDATVDEFAALCRTYQIKRVVGDAYSGEWVRSAFRKRGIDYQLSERTASEAYKELIPLTRQKKIALLDDKIQLDQFKNLIHKQSPTGDDKIMHPPVDHDDRANVATLAILEASGNVEIKFLPNQTYTTQQRTSASSRFSQTDFAGRRSAYNRGFGR